MVVKLEVLTVVLIKIHVSCNAHLCYKIIKYVLISQNTTVLAKVVHGVSKLSTTCFGLYIGHHQMASVEAETCS